MWCYFLNLDYVIDPPKPINKPAMVALIKLASDPAITALMPRRAISPRRLGAIPPKPPIKIAIELKFAKPHNANVMIALVLSVN